MGEGAFAEGFPVRVLVTLLLAVVVALSEDVVVVTSVEAGLVVAVATQEQMASAELCTAPSNDKGQALITQPIALC